MDKDPEEKLVGASPTSIHPERSLARRLALATLAFSLVFTLSTVGIRTWMAWRDNMQTMKSELELIDQVFQRTLSKAIWEMDRATLQTQLDSVAQAAPIGRIELRILRPGREPEIIEQVRIGRSPLDRAPSLHQKLAVEPYEGAIEVVGELTLEGDERVLWRRLRGELVNIVVTQVIQSLLLAGLIMWMFNRSVTTHVRHIAWHLSQLTPANLGQALRLKRSHLRRDELTLLETGVNDLQSNLSAYLERQARNEREMAAHRDHLAELVDAQTAELRMANERLEGMTRSDPLTGLANRRHFDEVKEIEFRRAARLGQPLTVLMCDVDFFKLYNDTYGHAMGDACLQTVAETLKSVFTRAGELVARIGGEEFAVLLPGTNASSAHNTAEQLGELLASRHIPHSASTVAPYVTISAGIAQFDPNTMDSFDQLLQAADQALYRAKSNGRNQIAD